MSPLLIVQNNYVEHLTGPLAVAARARGIEVFDVSFHSGIDIAFPDVGERPVLIYGSVGFIRFCKERFPQWIFWEEDRMLASRWDRELGHYMLNHDGQELTVEQFSALYDIQMHVRPLEMDKWLTGGLYRPPEVITRTNSLDRKIWVAKPKDILAEIRIWWIDRKAVAQSMYRCNGEHRRTADHEYVVEAVEYAQTIASHFMPMHHCVMDVCLTLKGWYVVEFNPLHSSGWYAADPGLVMDRYFEAVMPR